VQPAQVMYKNMKFPLSILFLLFTSSLFAQLNLVPNPSFEDTVTCPYDIKQIYFAVDWYPFGPNPDYFNTCSSSTCVSVPGNCFGFQYPSNNLCNAYCGIYTYTFNGCSGREYIGSQLTSALIIGKKYYVSFKVSLADSLILATNKLGVLFSTVAYTYAQPATFRNYAHIYTDSVITNTNNWTTITGSFVADSVYKYIMVGNFFNDSNTATLPSIGHYPGSYYYIDDVCVSRDSLYSYNYSCTCITTGSTDYSKSDIEIFPNPAANELTIACSMTDKGCFELYDVIGAKRKNITLDSGPNTKRINLTGLNNGLYFYCICDWKGNKIKTGKVIVQKK
jgi:hypothetical protein